MKSPRLRGDFPFTGISYLLDIYMPGDTRAIARGVNMCLQPLTLWIPNKLLRKRIPMTVSCGKCVECLSRYSREWALRICQEADLYEHNCFLTLTYADTDGELHPKHLQDFIKRLRRRLEPLRIRYFACGEYGSKGSRPHYHLIVFGWRPDDLYPWLRTKKGELIYRSSFLEEVWTFGFSSVGDLSFDSAKYCAKYLQKLNDVSGKVQQPFVRMSSKPGIGFNAINIENAVYDCIYYDGKQYRVPRYYLKVLERSGYGIDGIRYHRLQRMRAKKPLTRLELKSKREEYVRLFGKWRSSP